MCRDRVADEQHGPSRREDVVTGHKRVSGMSPSSTNTIIVVSIVFSIIPYMTPIPK